MFHVEFLLRLFPAVIGLGSFSMIFVYRMCAALKVNDLWIWVGGIFLIALLAGYIQRSKVRIRSASPWWLLVGVPIGVIADASLDTSPGGRNLLGLELIFWLALLPIPMLIAILVAKYARHWS
jgi:tellurite resistance protein TehA-like permease